ncbi:F-box only protein 40-like [Arapaima gigas]
MRRNRRPAAKQHQHCEKCFSLNCNTPVEISVSCLIISCRLLCGAAFHMCKEEEHRLLCPYEKVPCLSVDYGCPLTMCRSKLADHLKVCPASVVSCSMDWNRWPAEDTNGNFYNKLMKKTFSDEQLDLCMALRDQKLLLKKLKMKAFFPELTENNETPTPSTPDEAVGGTDVIDEDASYSHTDEEMDEVTQEECRVSENKEGLSIRNYKLAEKMFSMERGGCKHMAKTDGKKSDEKQGKKISCSQPQLHEEPKESKNSEDTASFDIGKTGFAPWQEGVLERLGKEVNPREFNMYLVHHGRMLIRFGQMSACTPREKDFVYGNLEPIPVQTLRSFKVPTSYREKRIHLKDPSTKVKSEHKSVDTSDLGLPEEEIPKMDEVQLTLLCSAEKELRGHKICETVVTDGLFVDFGTQTYNFHSAPFPNNATLEDITADQTVQLYLHSQTEAVTSRHNKANSAFTFLCNHCFRRDEFPSHFKNVHADIQSSLNGWFEQRCPLAYLGCTYSQKRFQPSTHRATVTYNQDLGTFTLKPEVPTSLFKGVKTIKPERKQTCNANALSRLPFEVLVHIAGFLDSLSLSQLALVSKTMRDVCAALLQERGMVCLKWEKKTYSHGGSRWKSRKIWQFSNHFSTVNRWCFGNIPSISEHLKHCSFYQAERRSEPVALVSMSHQKDEKRKQQSVITMSFGHQ